MNDELKTVQGEKAKKFVKAVADGKTVKEAETESGITKRAIVREPALMKRLQHLINQYTFDDLAGTAVVRARLMEILMMGEDKDSVQAAKTLTPLLGVQQSKEVIHHVIIDSPEARESMEYVNEYVEGEFEEVDDGN